MKLRGTLWSFYVACCALAVLSSESHAEYVVCRDSADNKEFLVCNAKSCPGGSTFVSWSPSDHQNCTGDRKRGSYDYGSCAPIQAIGWTWSKGGNKNSFCKSKGYAGVLAAEECHTEKEYKDGGWCYTEGELQICKNALHCVDAKNRTPCQDIKALDWIGGHKTKFCQGRGYKGVLAAADCYPGKSYDDGGWCFDNQDECRSKLSCTVDPSTRREPEIRMPSDIRNRVN